MWHATLRCSRSSFRSCRRAGERRAGPARSASCGLLVLGALVAVPAAWAQGPSFSCAAVGADSIEALVCADEGLSRLDRQLAEVYGAALDRAADERPPVLKAEQRGWIKGRDDCWKSDDRRRCVEDSYRLRTAELQARYRLVGSSGPVTFTCNGNAADQVVATYFDTDPPTLIAERGDQVSLMVREPAGSGAKYQGRNESLWEHQGEALIRWGYGSAELRCRRQPH
jgi:uncharacterized protein